eukprot:GFUD01007433.1.p1 GENE.GFUD01007433.1~~GFUD01007433.1.p1  ORF type:complete len:256 (+),score=64.70 GFUD01007433.1:174-941(+)
MSSPIWNVPHLSAGVPEPSADPDRVTVYNMRFCPFAQRTILVLLSKKIPFDVVNINLKKKPDWFVEKTWGAVSVVRYKGEYIMESLVNSDFVDELYPSTALHPKDPLDKAMGRLLVEKFAKMIKPYYGVMTVKGETPEEAKANRLEKFDELKKTLDCMDKELKKKGTKFFSGGSFGMTDLMVWPWIERLPEYSALFPGEKLDIPKEMTSLLAWIRNMWEVPAVKAYGLNGETHAKFHSQYFSEHCDFDMLLTKGA